MKLQTQTRVFAEVEDCPRCGGDHKDEYSETETDERGNTKKINAKLVFWPLANPQEHEGDMWCFCPTTNEPILATREQLGS